MALKRDPERSNETSSNADRGRGHRENARGFERLLLVLLVIFLRVTPCLAETDDVTKIVIPLDKPSPLVTAARNGVAESLAGKRPKAHAKPASFVAEDGRFVLWGELFGHGESFALVEITVRSEDQQQWNTGLVGFAGWKNDHWELRELLNIPTVWRPKGWKENDEDYLPITPTDQPFKLKDLSGDGVPEVIVAGEVDKYFQEYYLLRFDSRTRSLRLVADAMAEPEYVRGYVRLYYQSPRRAIWGEWRFLKWERDELTEKASWYEEVPYSDPEGSFVRVTRVDEHRRETIYRLDDEGSGSDRESIYKITRGDKPFAEVTFKWPKSRVDLVALSPSEMENQFLFERLTGVPRKVFPQRGDSGPLKAFEKLGKVSVSGEPEAVKLFRSKRWPL